MSWKSHQFYLEAGLDEEQLEEKMATQWDLQEQLQGALAGAGLEEHGIEAAKWCTIVADVKTFRDVARKLEGLVNYLELDGGDAECLRAAVAGKQPPPRLRPRLVPPPSIERRAPEELLAVSALSIGGAVLWGPEAVAPSTLVREVKLRVLDSVGRAPVLDQVVLVHGCRGLRDGETVGACLRGGAALTAVFSADVRSGTVRRFQGAFGFVHSPDVAKDHPLRDVFLHKCDCDGFRPHVGDTVQFHLTLDDKRGFPKAVKVRRILRPSCVGLQL